ncbi:MFS transporter [Actinocrispum wychmicini]|uniref:Putative MFS family arabinose efflux permease n=1 Tax=Actinocrispum wychmicini TaxID=1213861 RepID=A0A4R2JUV1_9PSEU|nr:MFS transporter [Actinocrispum wychmicini]TCO61056.1 putative MFS family arabinose efflux permease [Actinocrispum wychmicini]
MSRQVALLFSVACGLAVANVYYFQPLLDVIAADFQMDHATVGVIGTATQVGYGAGLLLLVPLGDLVNRRRLVVGQTLLSVLALIAVTLVPTAPLLLAAMTAVGALAVVTQVLVAYSAHLADPTDRGRMVGVVTSGIIIGILLARTVSGTIADLAGWRSVYAVSAAATLVMAWLLARVLPHEPTPRQRMSYPRLIKSVFRLFAEERVLRTRAVLALLIFTALTTFATPMVLPLSAPPYALSTTEVGLFGLAGVAGALGASRAGRLADRGHAQQVTAVGLTAMLLSWLPIALLPQSLWALAIGLVMFDFGLQSTHVANQSLIFEVRPEARSRLTAGYMVFYSIGSATGAIVSTVVYSQAGWTGVCVLGAAVSLTALVYWAASRLTILAR